MLKKIAVIALLAFGCDSVVSTPPDVSGEKEIAPFGVPDGFATIKAPASPDLVLSIPRQSTNGLAITLSASTVLKTPPVSQENPVPLTAIVEFGNDKVSGRIEVDVPVGRLNSLGGMLTPPESGALFMNLPSNVLNIYARNDSYYITPDNNGLVGDSDLSMLTPPVRGGDAASAILRASASFGTGAKIGERPTRTYYIGAITAAGHIKFVDDPARAYTIPPLAKRFRLLRTGEANGPSTGSVYDAAGNVLSSFSTGAEISEPWIDLPGTAHRVGVATFLSGAGGTAELVFEIGI